MGSWAGEGGGVEAAVGVAVQVFKVLSQDKVLAVFCGADHRGRQGGLDRVQQRFVEQNFETPGVVLVEV